MSIAVRENEFDGDCNEGEVSTPHYICMTALTLNQRN